MQQHVMHKSDSVDFTSRAKLLLELMTNDSTEESSSSEAEDCIISSAESETDDIENDDNEDCPELVKDEPNFGNGRNYDTVFHLNQFFEDHVENTRRHLSSSTRNNVWNDFQFEEKMYRVIPLKLDPKVSTSANKHRVDSRKR